MVAKVSQLTTQLKSIMKSQGGVTTNNFQFRPDEIIPEEWYGYDFERGVGEIIPEEVFISGYRLFHIICVKGMGSTQPHLLIVSLQPQGSVSHTVKSFSLTISGDKLNFVARADAGSITEGGTHVTEISNNLFQKLFLAAIENGEFHNVTVSDVVI